MSFLWNRYTRFLVLLILRCYPVRKNRVLCVSWNGTQYNCNPKVIAESLLKTDKYDVWYAFINPDYFKDKVKTGIKSVELGSLEYFKILSTSKFIIANVRFGGDVYWPFPKKKSQYYIQTMHGPHGVKKVEFAAIDTLSKEYINFAIDDNKRIDLMLSNSEYSTERCRSAFLYSGEILEQGLPRNDIFFCDELTRIALKNKMLAYIRLQKLEVSVDLETQFLIYTPTFRDNGKNDVYGFDVDMVVNALESRFSGKWFILVSSHPNMATFYREIYDFSHPRIVDVGRYPEFQELLVVCDALITDYSSAEMDFSLTRRPQFQLIRDREDYDRGTYLDPRSLPFPYAENDEELCENIMKFNYDVYLSNLKKFQETLLGVKETGHASEAVLEWIKNKQ